MSQKVIGIDCLSSGLMVEIPYEDSSSVAVGDNVIFKDEEGKEEFGTVACMGREAVDPEKILVKSKILRPATPRDLQKAENYFEQGGSALESCRKYVEKYELDMQVFRAGYSFDGSKVYFMFTADERVDFRDLVKDLAKTLKKQIYLRQVGPRDKAKVTGGYGKCGRSLCCNTFLGKLESVSMDMVRVQSLESKGSSKLSGACGKLLCCLRYEVEIYKALRKGLPEVGAKIRIKKDAAPVAREGEVIALDVINQKLRVLSSDREFMIIDASDVDKVLSS